MSKLSLSIFINSYSDISSSNAPDLQNVKWNRSLSSIPVDNPSSESLSLAPGESKNIFSGSRTLSHDNTTHYSLLKKSLTANTYILKAISGTLPNFRTPRTIASDATTQVSISLNGPLAIIASVAGTNFDFSTSQVGDFVRIGSLFNTSNRGEFKILAKTATSVTVENELAVAEGPITLSVGFADQVQVYSAAGVQKGDTVVISGGFSAVSQKSFKVTDVASEYIEFYSTDALPDEANVQTNQFVIYSASKQLIYIEASKKVSVTINGVLVSQIEPFIINNSSTPGIFLLKSTIYSLNLTNSDTDSTSIFLVTVE